MTATAIPVPGFRGLPGLRPAPPVPELLWQERSVAVNGPALRVEVPLTAPLPHGADVYLSEILDGWWTRGGRLAADAVIDSVVASVVEHPLAGDRLILLVSSPGASEMLAGPAMARDLRRALRDLQLALGSSWALAG